MIKRKERRLQLVSEIQTLKSQFLEVLMTLEIVGECYEGVFPNDPDFTCDYNKAHSDLYANWKWAESMLSFVQCPAATLRAVSVTSQEVRPELVLENLVFGKEP